MRDVAIQNEWESASVNGPKADVSQKSLEGGFEPKAVCKKSEVSNSDLRTGPPIQFADYDNPAQSRSDP